MQQRAPMHTLPDKLTSLRHSIEATYNRRFIELEARFEKELKDGLERAEESALARAKEHATSVVSKLEEKLESETGHLSRRIDDLLKVQHGNQANLRAEVDKQGEYLQGQITSVSSQLPSLRIRIQAAEEALHNLERFPPDFSEALEATKVDLKTVKEDFDGSLAVEKRRAESAEALLRADALDAAQAAAAATRGVEERTLEQFAHTRHDAAQMEDRFRCHLDEVAKRSAADDARHSTFAEEARQKLAVAIDMLHDKVVENRRHSDEATAALDLQLRNELRGEGGRTFQNAKNEIERRVEELEVIAARRDENLRSEMANFHSTANEERKAHVSQLERRTESAHEELRETHSDVHRQLRVAIGNAETRAAAHCTEVLESASSLTEHRFVEVAAAARREDKEEFAALRRADEASTFQLRDDINKAEQACRRHAESVGDTCKRHAELSVNTLSDRVRADHSEARAEMHGHVESRHAAVLRQIEEERTTRSAAHHDLHQTHHKRLDEVATDLHARVASHSAETKTRFDSIHKRVDGVDDVTRDLGVALQSHKRVHLDAVAEWNEQLREAVRVLDRADAATVEMLEKVRDKATEHLLSESSSLNADLAETRANMHEEFSVVHQDIQRRALHRDVADVGTATSGVTAALGQRIANAEGALDRQRDRVESLVREVLDRCDTQQAQTNDGRTRMEKEISTLGTELTGVRAASTSLTHGVLKALQVIGLVNSELDVSPPRLQNGTSPLVHRRWGVEVADLLEWEKSGNSLAKRVHEHWQPFEAVGAPNMLALVSQKANEKDLRSLGTSLRLWTPAPKLDWMPSAHHSGGAFSARTATTSVLERELPRHYQAVNGRSEGESVGTPSILERELQMPLLEGPRELERGSVGAVTIDVQPPPGPPPPSHPGVHHRRVTPTSMAR